jgi:large subunit ribosomal protein L21
MYVIVDIQGQQFKVEKDQKLFVHRLEGEEGAKVEFDKILLADNDGSVTIGAPVIEGAKVVAEIVNPLVKGDKVLVFHKKRRKGHRKLNGHRQQFSQIVIKEIQA